MSAKKVADALSGVLADTYVLFAKTQNYHWNVVGPQFYPLHLLFESQYHELFNALDEIAERIRQIGQESPGTLAEFLRLTVISETSATSAAGMVADLAACNDRVASRSEACLKLAEDDGDDFTVDLMVRRIGAHGKAGWMLRSTLGDEPVGTMPAVTKPVARPVAATKTEKNGKKSKTKVKKVATAKSVVTRTAVPSPAPVAKTSTKTKSKPAPQAVVKSAPKSAPKKPASATQTASGKKKTRVAMG